MRFILFLVFLVYLVLARWFFICEIRQLCADPVTEEVRLNTLIFRDGDSIVLRGYDHFRFDTAAIKPILNENNQIFLDSVSIYLLRAPDKNLTITGRYTQGESDLSFGFLENIGVARADALRQELTRRGIDRERISLDYQLDQTGNLRRPAAFDAFLADSSRYRKQAFTFANMSFTDANFEFGSAEFRPGPSCVAYMDSVQTYLSLNPDSRLKIIGHTDSVDTHAFNYRLGLDRARSTQVYMEEIGVSSDRITVDSEGETQPVAPNKTDEGRQKNRRVVFLIQAPSSQN